MKNPKTPFNNSLNAPKDTETRKIFKALIKHNGPITYFVKTGGQKA